MPKNTEHCSVLDAFIDKTDMTASHFNLFCFHTGVDTQHRLSATHIKTYLHINSYTCLHVIGVISMQIASKEKNDFLPLTTPHHQTTAFTCSDNTC